jgi:hypothetical protein
MLYGADRKADAGLREVWIDALRGPTLWPRVRLEELLDCRAPALTPSTLLRIAPGEWFRCRSLLE